ncbi:MAG TPA: HEAT repeat domain-containing protein [Gemmatimonadales bacterium]|nr:HEAT repeat domain-containing protein [Gemmatimonadales bacterium]
MSSRHALALVALWQAALFVVLILLILANRWYGVARRSRLRPRRIAVDTAMKNWALDQWPLDPVVKALGALPAAAAVEALVAWSARIAGERWQALAGALQKEPWVQALRDGVPSRQWWTRLQAARLLAIVATPEDVPLLSRLLLDAHPAVHIAAVAALERLDEPSLIATAIDRLATLPSTVQALYASVLRRSRGSVVEALRGRLAQRDDPGLARIAEFAARLDDPALREFLTPLADHPSTEVRVQVARALGGFPHPTSVLALGRLARDATWEVRAQAMRAIGRIADPTGLPVLTAGLRDPVWWVRLRAALGLTRFGVAGRDALLQAERGADPDGRYVARLILGLSPQALTEFAA